MSRDQFVEHEFTAKAEAMIAVCNKIISEYQRQGFTLTLRQLYYQLVSRDVIPNVERSYKNLSALLSNARLAGLVDWDAIEDRIRQPVIPLEFENLDDRIDSALANYRLPRWSDQPEYVELWVEKDALAGVLEPIAHQFHIVLMVNRGYSSQSAMYEAANRIKEAQERVDDDPRSDGSTTDDKQATILYLGDLDPSGEDMVRDIQERMDTFNVTVDVEKLALTPAQVKQYKPPPNPAKMTDPRAGDYVARHGNKSWEVDALPPQVLNQLVVAAIRSHLDAERMNKWIEKEKRDKELLKKAVESVRKKK